MQSKVAVGSLRLRERRLIFEIASAAALTVVAIAIVVQSPPLSSSGARKATLQIAANEMAPTPSRSGDAKESVSDFMETFALSHVAQPLPENLIDLPNAAGLGGATAASVAAAIINAQSPRDPRRVAPKSTTAPSKANAARAAAKSAPLRQVQNPPEAPLAIPEKPAAASPERRIPVISTISDYLPAPKTITTGFGNLGKRIGALFSRS